VKNVYVIGVGMTQFGKIGKTVYELGKEAVEEALADAQVSKDAVQSAYVSNCLWGCFEGQHGVRGASILRQMAFDLIPIYDVEAACASAAVAFNGAWKEIQTGLYDCTLALGVERMTGFDREKTMAAFNSFIEVAKAEELAANTKARMEKVLEAVTVPEDQTKSRFMAVMPSWRSNIWRNTVATTTQKLWLILLRKTTTTVV
jgi:acetyl-CoA acetyltransferase